jgi:hypothetical protein
MTAAVMDILWSREPVVEDRATVHALVIGVSKYDYLPGGAGPVTDKALLAGLGQLSAAATAATRIANWLRDNFEYPNVQLGSVRLLASPSPGELPLAGGANPPPATSDEVKKALTRWRRDARGTPGNITLLFVAGHGIQTSNEGGILLLQDVGHPDSEPLDRALDVAAIRLGMVADPTDPETSTPPVQYYFYDACRVQPAGLPNYQELKAGIGSDIPRGPAPDMSWVLWGSRSRDYALADPETKTTLFSKALIDCLESRAPADKDGRTVRFGLFQLTLEEVVDELASAADEQQSVVPGGSGQVRTPVFLRRLAPPVGRDEAERRGEEALEREWEEQLRRYEEPPRRGGMGRPPPLGPRPVTVTTEIHEPRGVTIRGNGVVIEAVTETPVELAPGAYTVAVDQPWGGTARTRINVPSGSDAMEILINVPDQPPRSTAGSPRLVRQLGAAGGAASSWFLRFLTWTPEGLQHRSEVTPPAVEVDDLDADTVAIIMHAHGENPQYAQLLTGDGRSLVVALPISTSAGQAEACWLHVRVSETALGAVVRFNDQSLDVYTGYLTGGRPDHVVTLAPSAEDLLYSKVQNPIAATIGGYALLKLNDLDRMHNWADNLAAWFEWLPDGAVIAGEVAARRGMDAHAAELFQTAIHRGLPLFTEGLSLLATRLPRLLVDDDLDRSVRDQLQGLAQLVLTASPMAEFGALATTLRTDVDPGPITKEMGWQEFVRTTRPADPRDFWRAP